MTHLKTLLVLYKMYIIISGSSISIIVIVTVLKNV